MPLDPTISLQAKVPSISDAMAPMASMMNIQNSVQQLKNAQLANQQGQVGLQSSQLDLDKQNQLSDERLRVQAYYQAGKGKGPDGLPDLTQLHQDLPLIAPLSAQDYIGKATTVMNAHSLATKAKLDLSQDQQSSLAAPAVALARENVKTHQPYFDAWDAKVKAGGGNKAESDLVSAWKTNAKFIPPDKLPEVMLNAMQTVGTSADSAALAPKAGLTTVGPRLEQTISTPAIGGAPPSIQIGQNPAGAGAPIPLGLDQRYSIQPGPTGDPNQYVVAKDPNTGRPIGNVPLGDAGQGGPPAAVVPQAAPGPPAWNGVPPQGPDASGQLPDVQLGGSDVVTPLASVGAPVARTIPAAPQRVAPQAAGRGMPVYSPEDVVSRPILEAERSAARNAALAAPAIHTNNRIVMEELDKALSTGPTGAVSSRLSGILGAFGIKAGATWADAHDLIGKALMQNVIASSKGMGQNTDAGLAASNAAWGSTAMNPGALRTLAKYSDALATGTEIYSPGLEKAIAANPARGALVKREFDANWAANFDARIPAMQNAINANDKKEMDRIKAELGKSGMAAMARKTANLDALAHTGALPGQR